MHLGRSGKLEGQRLTGEIGMPPGQDQMRVASRRLGGLHVAQAVAHIRHPRQRHTITFGNLLQQTRGRLAEVQPSSGACGQ
jgi:hypothetical protein